MNTKAFFSISCGLYIVTAKINGKDNGCITNTLVQVTSDPAAVSVTLNNKNLTTEMISDSSAFSIAMLTQSTPFSVFEIFGFKSGRDTDKFAQGKFMRGANGLYYPAENTNAYLECKVINTVKFKTHTMFFGEVAEAEILSGEPSLTYEYYHKNIKPAPQYKKTGFRCKICNYVFEGESLPSDFVCPICKHGSGDFEKL